MTRVIRIVVDGAPIGKGRPRFVRMGGLTRAFTPTKTANYEAVLAAAGAEAMAGRPPLEGPLLVCLTAFMPIAASWSKKKAAAALEGAVRPGKPDLDNILKTLDALNSIVWRDDAQIAEARLSKLYDTDPRLEIEVAPLTERHVPELADGLIAANSTSTAGGEPRPIQGALL
jgi:Holliday junction resolvase RusA-like endonuclease